MSRFLAAFRAGREDAVSSAPKSENPEKGENPGSGASAEEFSGFSPFSDFGRAEIAPEPDPDDARERAAMADHYAAPADACPWRPGDPDPLRDGLLAGWRAGQSRRLNALALRLEAARPRRSWGVRELDWRAWQAAALAAAGLPSGEWATWRTALGTAEAPLPRRGTSDRSSFAHAGDHGP